MFSLKNKAVPPCSFCPSGAVRKEKHSAVQVSTVLSITYTLMLPSPPIILVSSWIRSIGNGGNASGFIASNISFMELSYTATRFELKAPHLRHRWMMAHSPLFLTHTAMESIYPPQSASLSPGSMST